MCTGQYHLSKIKGKYFSVSDEADAEKVARAISSKKYPEICINEQCSGMQFEIIKQIINKSFSDSLPNKSSFERGMI